MKHIFSNSVKPLLAGLLFIASLSSCEDFDFLKNRGGGRKGGKNDSTFHKNDSGCYKNDTIIYKEDSTKPLDYKTTGFTKISPATFVSAAGIYLYLQSIGTNGCATTVRAIETNKIVDHKNHIVDLYLTGEVGYVVGSACTQALRDVDGLHKVEYNSVGNTAYDINVHFTDFNSGKTVTNLFIYK